MDLQGGPLSLFEVAVLGQSMVLITREVRIHGLEQIRAPGPRTWLLRKYQEGVPVDPMYGGLMLGGMHEVQNQDGRGGYYKIIELQQLVLTLRYLFYPDAAAFYAADAHITVGAICPNESVCPAPLRALVEYAFAIDPRREAFDSSMYNEVMRKLMEMSRSADSAASSIYSRNLWGVRRLRFLTPDPVRVRQSPLEFTVDGHVWRIGTPIGLGTRHMVFKALKFGSDESSIALKCGGLDIEQELEILTRITHEDWAPKNVALVQYANYLPLPLQCIRMKRYSPSFAEAVTISTLVTANLFVEMGRSLLIALRELHTHHNIAHGAVTASNVLPKYREEGIVLIDYSRAIEGGNKILDLEGYVGVLKVIGATNVAFDAQIQIDRMRDVLNQRTYSFSPDIYQRLDDILRELITPPHLQPNPTAAHPTIERPSSQLQPPEAANARVLTNEPAVIRSNRFRYIIDAHEEMPLRLPGRVDAHSVEMSTGNIMACRMFCVHPDIAADRRMILSAHSNLQMLQGRRWVERIHEFFEDSSAISCLATERFQYPLLYYEASNNMKLGAMGLRMLDITEELHGLGFNHRESWSTSWMLRQNDDIDSLVLTQMHALRPINLDNAGVHRLKELQQIVLNMRISYHPHNSESWACARFIPSRNVDAICPSSTECTPALRSLIAYILSLGEEQSASNFPVIYSAMRRMMLNMI